MTVGDAVIDGEPEGVVKAHESHTLTWGHFSSNCVNLAIAIIEVISADIDSAIVVVVRLWMLHTEVTDPVVLLVGSLAPDDVLVYA